MKTSTKIIINFMLLIVFLLCNWVGVDFMLINRTPVTNGIWTISNYTAWGHMLWYLSMAIGIIFAIQIELTLLKREVK